MLSMLDRPYTMTASINNDKSKKMDWEINKLLHDIRKEAMHHMDVGSEVTSFVVINMAGLPFWSR